MNAVLYFGAWLAGTGALRLTAHYVRSDLLHELLASIAAASMFAWTAALIYVLTT